MYDVSGNLITPKTSKRWMITMDGQNDGGVGIYL